jgi:hypothetical protein
VFLLRMEDLCPRKGTSRQDACAPKAHYLRSRVISLGFSVE